MGFSVFDRISLAISDAGIGISIPTERLLIILLQLQSGAGTDRHQI
jgi:hypothetical protein